jgi:PAS domain S-box-containing protein
MERAQPSRLNPWVIAVLAVATATLVRALLAPLLGHHLPFVAYYVAVAVVAFWGNLAAAIATTVAGAALGDYFFGAAILSAPPVGEDIAVGLFILSAVVLAMVSDRVSKTRQRLQRVLESSQAKELEVQRERARLQEIIASIPGIVWEAWGEPDSAQQRINYVSDYVQHMLGYSPGEWTSTPNFWLQIVPPEDREAAGRVAAERFKAGTEGEHEFRWMTKDGRICWVLARSNVIKDASGQSVGMRGVTFDITDRKVAERRLALLADISTTGLIHPSFAEVAHYIARRTAEVLGDACVIGVLNGDKLERAAYAHRLTDAEGYLAALTDVPDLAAANPSYRELLQNPRTIVVGEVPTDVLRRIEDEVGAPTVEKYKSRSGVLCPLVSSGHVFGTLALGRADRARYADDEIRLVEAIAARAALLLENARLIETAQREAEQARRARSEAEEAGRAKDEFLATLSHELRTPLNAILGWAHMLQDPSLPTERRRAAIDTIVRNAQSQEQLIADILDVQRIMAGKIRLNVNSINLGDIVRSAAETVQPSADAKQIRLQLLVDLDVPPIVGDADRMKQVVWNLLSNAIKFAPKAGRVQVRLLRGDDMCELIVEDNGPGITPEFMPFMFERFRQADSSTTRAHKGLGLGLAIVRSLVEMHGGTITATNVTTDGQTGAMFTIRLPIQGPHPTTADSDSPALGERPPHWLEKVPSLDGLHVLVVEDDTDARELLIQILGRFSARVTAAASAAEGFAAFQQERPDVLISDIEMPEEDGYAFIRRIRALDGEAGRDVPAAAVTAYASPSDRLRVLGAGFNMHLAKPVQPAELALVVASLAGRVR